LNALGAASGTAHVTAAEELLPELAMIAKERPEALLVYPDVVLSSIPGLSNSQTLRSRLSCPRCTRSVFTSTPAVSCPMARLHPKSIRPRLSKLQKFWMALGRVSCRCEGDPFRAGHQQQDCEGARTHNSSVAAGASRRGYRIGAMSAFGTSRHRQVHRKHLLSGVKRSRICFHAARGTSMAAQY
jgi:hypothetical protein